MDAFWQMRALLLLTILFGLTLFTTLLPNGSMAQGQTLPTPTNIGNGGNGGNGNGDDDDGGGDDATPKPLGARVSGFVYNYSTGGYEGGVKVIVSGGGWEVETVSDSNGFYQVGDLGAGNAIVNLLLPPDAHPVNADTSLWLVSGVDVRVDLGFYWGDTPSIPVQLSGNLADNILTVQLENHTAQAATGGQIEIALPASILASPGIQASQGTVDYGEHKLRVSAGEVPAGAKVAVTIPIEGQEVPTYAQTNASVQITFTYDQQYTPQVIRIIPNQPAPVTAQSSPPATSVAAVVVTTPSTPVPPTPVATQTQLKPLPTTGSQLKSSNFINVWLSILVVMGLGVAGWYSWRIKS